MLNIVVFLWFVCLLLQFISSLKDNLNAEVVLGTVTNVKEACAWLRYTYLAVRMRLNPLAYGIGWDEVFSITHRTVIAAKHDFLFLDSCCRTNWQLFSDILLEE